MHKRIEDNPLIQDRLMRVGFGVLLGHANDEMVYDMLFYFYVSRWEKHIGPRRVQTSSSMDSNNLVSCNESAEVKLKKVNFNALSLSEFLTQWHDKVCKFYLGDEVIKN